MRSLKRYALPFFVVALIASGCTPKPSDTTITPSSSHSPAGDSTTAASSEWRAQANAIFKPIAEPEGLSPQMVELGRILYYDPRLSKSGTISCNSCHGLDRYGVDGEPTSPGHDGRRGARNSPTVYNAALHFTQFWDGRAKTVEEQAMGPILNPIEMGVADEQTVTKSLPRYQNIKSALPRFSQLIKSR